MPSNQHNQQIWSRLLAYYGPPSTETLTTETTTVRCHKNSQFINLISTYYWCIWFEISNNSSTIRYHSKWKKTLFAQH